MGKIPGINHLDGVRALQKAGFQILRQGKRIVMSDAVRILTIPRHNPINAYTMGGIAHDMMLVSPLMSSGGCCKHTTNFFPSSAPRRFLSFRRHDTTRHDAISRLVPPSKETAGRQG